MRLGELAEILGLELEGDAEREISGLASLGDASASELSFVIGGSHRAAFESSKAGALLLPLDFDAAGRACLRSPLPYRDFARAVELFHPARPVTPGVHPSAVIADDASLGEGVSIGPYAVVGAGARVGDRCVIHANVTLYPDVVLGADCEIHSGVHLREARIGDRVSIQNGSVIGAEGFGFVVDYEGLRVRVPHRCPVEIGDDSHIGANVTIDASHPAHPRHGGEAACTRIGKNVTVDNQVQIGHGVCVEDGVTLCAQVGLAGSSIIERGVLMAGKASTAGHLTVGAGSLVGGNSGVINDLAPNSVVIGWIATERRTFLRAWSLFTRLPEIWKRLRRVEARENQREE